MTPELFFQGRLAGWGVACDPFGRVLRRFTVEMAGEWSEEHRAVHLDETYSFVDGKSFERRWVVHSDEEGCVLGYDAIESARLRGRLIGPDIHVTFDRLRRPGGRLHEPIHDVRFLDVASGASMMLGKVKRWGVVIAVTSAAFRRLA